MFGGMMDVPLLVSSLIRHAGTHHADTEVVSRDAAGLIHRYTYGECHRRSRQLAQALVGLGLEPGERVGTLAWNGHRHLELYYAVSGAGFVIHTINPRLFHDQIVGIIEDAAERILFVDPTIMPLLDTLSGRLTRVEAVVVMADRSAMPTSAHWPRLLCYEDLIEGQPDGFDWPQLDERTAAGLCYTSGTTGPPKGVLYTHRSCLLQAMAICMPDTFGLSATDTVMPVVPMFHVNAWSLPYAAVMVGAKLVLPGPKLDGVSLHGLIAAEGVTMTAGVPTLWSGLLDTVEADGLDLRKVRRVGIGGSACPPVMIERFNRLGVTVVHAWGMTETSPVALASLPKHKQRDLSETDALALKAKQGRPLFGVEIRVIGPEGKDLPFDGNAIGRLLVRGPWVASHYFNAASDEPAFAEPGWFDTGDVVTIDPDGFVTIVDRAKDVIKSGGEWISSIAIENIAMAHPAVHEAAVIGRPDARWGERPVLFVVPRAGAVFTAEDCLAHFGGKVARWCVPTDVRSVETLPRTATGKLAKTALRELL